MDLVVCADARVLFLQYLIAKWGQLYVGLYQQQHAPAVTDDVGTYQRIECNFPVYVRQPIPAWVGVALDADNVGVALGSFVNWTVTYDGTPNDVYGYFVVDSKNNLLWAQADPAAPQPMHSVGQRYRVAPQLALGALC